MTTRWIARLFFPRVTPADYVTLSDMLGIETARPTEPLKFFRWRDGQIVWPHCPEAGGVVITAPVPWKDGHGRRHHDWEDRR